MTSAHVLVINCGSSSVKFAALEPETGAIACHGLAERLGTRSARLLLDGAELELDERAGPAEVLARAENLLAPLELVAVGHRVVHGGEAFAESVLLDAAALHQIRAASQLAPLHNPANLLGIEAAQARFAGLPQVAVFDTAFHQSLPPKAYLYALPYELYAEQQVRRYGFHGTSHRYVAGEAALRIGKPLSELQLITAHLGNGCSTCAIKGGRSLDTSMGLTPLEGLVMGTRSGDVDPNLHQFLAERSGQSLSDITELFNRKSGLLGLSGLSNDMRVLLAAVDDNPRARLAVDVFCYRLAKSILALCAPLERLDALVFTGGIGEHAAPVRAQVLEELAFLGMELDGPANQEHGQRTGGRISAPSSRVLGLVIPTNEELVIAREAARCAGAARKEV